MEIEKKLLDFSLTIRNLMEKSENATKFAIESFEYLDKSVDFHQENLRTIFSEIDLKILREKNLKIASQELDTFLTIVDTIEKDKFEIMQGPRGLLSQYIKKLEYIKKIETYTWIKEQSTKFANKRVEVCYAKFNSLIRHSEKILLDEFQNLIKHYSNTEQALTFIDFLISKEDPIDDPKNEEVTKEETGLKNNTNRVNCDEQTNKQKLIEISDDSFMPKETLMNLEIITWWFLQREQQYELYDESLQHCDINQKLQFCQTRNEFLKHCLITYSKMNSLGFKKDSGGKFKQSMKQLFHQATNKSEKQDEGDQLSLKSGRTTSGGVNSNNQENSNRPVEYIELFADNLDFSLKLLKHENIIINNIYRKSYETRVDLTSKLTILVIDQIQKEFEAFFTKKESCDFTKISNSDDEVLAAIIKLIVKVQNLKEKASCLQTDDLNSASKLLMFSLKLNETSSQIFSSYLEVVKKGYNSTFELPHDSNVHEHVRNVCSKWRLIKKHEKYLLEPIKIACQSNFLNNEKENGENSSHREHFKNRIKDFGKKRIKSSMESDDVSEEEDTLEKYQRSIRRGRTEHSDSIMESAAIEMIQKEDFEFSPDWTFAKYYLLIEERIDEWLMSEIEKLLSTQGSSLMPGLSLSRMFSSQGSSFRQFKKEFKAFIFLVNNFDYILSFIDEIGINNIMKKRDSNFENSLKKNIEIQINKTKSLYDFLNSKWNKYNLAENQSAKQKRKDEFKILIRETFEIFFKTPILNKKRSDSLRDLISESLGTIFDELELSGDLSIILNDLDIRNDNYLENKKSLKVLALENMFPKIDYSLHIW